ncbi:uncharacterized protein LOC127704604 isoform X2 [Mytilus californianus]|uniref:uncharacterized protein LOC127704604 isoform X2 n=1 Tax=Mytilus californianus TaxID=6549 RepID=UPI002247939A|nr:uncharacterized protein LOC127704604 isoform X2 [Mytilus californianus]
MKPVVFIFSLLCIVLCLLAEIVSQVTGTDPCMGYSSCTTSCKEDLQHCRDPQRYIQGVCKIITGGCICQPGLVGATCNNTCEPGKYGIACTNPCNCDVKECNRATGCPSSDYTTTIIIIIVSTVIVIVGVISLCLIVRKYRLNKSTTKHLERAQDNSEAQLLSDGTRTRSGNDYEGIDTRFENTENMQVDSTHEQVLNSSDYVDMNMENDNPSTDLNNQPITIDNYTEIRDADLHQAEEENVQIESSSEQIASSYSYIDINLEKEPQHVRKNYQILTIDNYMEIRDEDLNQAEEFSLTPSYMSPNDITEIPAFFKSDNAYTVESDLRKITIGISDVPKIMNKQDEVYNILNRIPKQVKHFDTNYDHVTPNDDLYNDLNFTLK